MVISAEGAFRFTAERSPFAGQHLVTVTHAQIEARGATINTGKMKDGQRAGAYYKMKDGQRAGAYYSEDAAIVFFYLDMSRLMRAP